MSAATLHRKGLLDWDSRSRLRLEIHQPPNGNDNGLDLRTTRPGPEQVGATTTTLPPYQPRLTRRRSAEALAKAEATHTRRASASRSPAMSAAAPTPAATPRLDSSSRCSADCASGRRCVRP